MSEFDVSTGAAYAVLFSVLSFFTILAIGSAGWLNFLPDHVTRWCTLHGSTDTTTNNHSDTTTTASFDYFLSARSSAGTWSIALSFFATGMGAWVLYGTTEMGANPSLSWLGVIGYSVAAALPAVLIGSFLGPTMKAVSEDKAFSTTDFGRRRYGRVMQVSMALVSLFYMFIYIVAELTSIGNVFALLTNQESSKAYGIGITVVIGAVTIFYTTLAGLPASIVTDKFQGLMVALLVIILTIATTAAEANHVTREEFALASNWTMQGFKAMVSLIIAILCAEMFNQCTWQRVWAAESVPVMRKGFLIGSVMVFFLMMFFGVMGMIAYANDPEAYDGYQKLSFLSFFDLLVPLGEGWHILVLVLVTALASSSIDSLQNGLTAIFYHDLVRIGWNTAWVTRFLMVAVNIPAVYLASKKWDVIGLFLIADIICATSVFPVFCGLQTKDYGILKAPTELGAFMGCVSGVCTVLMTGAIVGADGGPWEYFWLRNDGICALCGNETMISFIVTPLCSLLATYVFSALDVAVRGERARQPLISVAFDKEVSSATKHGEEVEEDWVKEKSDVVEEEQKDKNKMEADLDFEVDA